MYFEMFRRKHSLSWHCLISTNKLKFQDERTTLSSHTVTHSYITTFCKLEIAAILIDTYMGVQVNAIFVGIPSSYIYSIIQKHQSE